MKKISAVIALTLAFACMFTLTSCGGNATTSTPPSASASASTSSSAPPASPSSSAPRGSSSVIPEAGAWFEVTGPLDIKHIGISFEALHSDFAAGLIAQINVQIEKHGWTYDLNESNENSMVQVQQCEDMIAKGIDALLLKPNDESSFASISQLCQEQNIPLLVLSDYLTSPYTTAALSDNYATGVEQAQYLLEHDPGTLHKVFLLRGPIVAELFNLRAQGAMDTLEAAGYEIVYSTDSSPVQDQAITATENFLATNQEIDVIVCGTDSQAIGAGIAVQEAGLSDKIYIIGIDGQEQGAQAIINGILDATLYKPPQLNVDTLFEAFDKMIAGEPYDQDNYIPSPFMDINNVYDYYPELKK